jgi:hypothetical protein
MHEDPNLLTTSEREQERRALDLFLAGTIGALKILPEDSAWRRCFLETKRCMVVAISRDYEDESDA